MALRDFRATELKQGVESNNDVGTLESIFAGLISGTIAIPKGFFSLGASIIDLGLGTESAAKVESFFDDLTEFDEKAEATTAGKITELLVNIGVPGGIAFTKASSLAGRALRARKDGKYLNLNNAVLKGQASKVADLNLKAPLNAQGQARQFFAGALGAGAAEGVFIGDVEAAGTLGDLLGGPTQIKRDNKDGNEAAKEIVNRIKFGTEGALFGGLIGGTATIIKKLANRTKNMDVVNNSIDSWIDRNIGERLRSRGGRTPEFFRSERASIGKRSADAAAARNISRTLDRDIDSIFPAMKTVFNKQSAESRNGFLEEINKLLLSGKPFLDDQGKAIFGEFDKAQLSKVNSLFQKYDVSKEIQTSILGPLRNIRSKWGDLFTTIGSTLDEKQVADFKKLFGTKFQNYLGTTFDVFQNKSLLPYLGYKPAAEAVRNAQNLFEKVAKEKGIILQPGQSELYVNDLLKNVKLPAGFSMTKASDPLFRVPDFFVSRTSADQAASSNIISLADLSQADRKVFEDLLGRTQNPMQTILGGMSKLSLIVRRNEFFQDLVNKNEDLIKKGKTPMFVNNNTEAANVFGAGNFRTIDIDPGQKLRIVGDEAEITNPLSGLITSNGMAEALEKTSFTLKDKATWESVYNNLVLYPKATSQIAKTILSPITHARNFISAGAFAAANGLVPLADPSAIKQAYSALQVGLRGTKGNELYEKLLKLGVVNSNVSLGDLTKLLEDVNFGSTMTSDKGFRMLLKPLSKIKQVGQDLYTAEDDFWKIYTFATEQKRLQNAFTKAGLELDKSKVVDFKGDLVTFNREFLENEAADIVRNNVPNYDFVSDFIKGTRKLPFGNFISFPAEIMRTSANIVQRALKEINYTQVVDGKTIKPLEGIGLTRLFGFGATTLAVPYAAVESAKALYNVTEDEIQALRRFVPDWSRNSSLVPIRNMETGKLSYVDFSHANAYDTITRPIQAVINAVADGRGGQEGLIDDFVYGMYEATQELGEPFLSESIWTEALFDVTFRKGRTGDGSRIFNPQDRAGTRVFESLKHLVKAQVPFSYSQFKRMDLAFEPVDIIAKGKFDKSGETFELGNEALGLFGFRVIDVNPQRSLKYKIRDYQRGVSDSRSLFTAKTLRGGPIEPQEIVDAYINANRALFNVRKEMMLDIDAANVLGVTEGQLNKEFERISKVDFRTLQEGVFRPYVPSLEIIQAFEDNSARTGVPNNYPKAEIAIDAIRTQLENILLSEPRFPFIENPLLPQPTPTGPMALNLPNINQQILSQSGQNNAFSNLTTSQKLAILFPR